MARNHSSNDRNSSITSIGSAAAFTKAATTPKRRAALVTISVPASSCEHSGEARRSSSGSASMAPGLAGLIGAAL